MRVAQLIEHLAKLDPDTDITVLACYSDSTGEQYYREDPRLVLGADSATLVGEFDVYGKIAALRKYSFPNRQEESRALGIDEFVIWRAK